MVPELHFEAVEVEPSPMSTSNESGLSYIYHRHSPDEQIMIGCGPLAQSEADVKSETKGHKTSLFGFQTDFVA